MRKKLNKMPKSDISYAKVISRTCISYSVSFTQKVFSIYVCL